MSDGFSDTWGSLVIRSEQFWCWWDSGEMMVGGRVNEPREGDAVCTGNPQSGAAEEVTEPRLGSAGWEPGRVTAGEFRNQQGGGWELNLGPGSMVGMELDGREGRAC